MTRFAVFISGSGTNLQAIIDAWRAGRVAGELALVVSNRPDAAGLARAERAGVPSLVVDHRQYEGRAAFEGALLSVCDAHRIEWVFLAGFMRILSGHFLSRFPARLVNIHPALLPAFPGIHAQAQALEAGVKMTGVTVHFVDEGVDTGPIIAQEAVPVLDDDTSDRLSARIQAVEHVLYPRVIDGLLRGQYAASDPRAGPA